MDEAGRDSNSDFHSVVIVGGGAGGIAVATSLLKRSPSLDIAIVEPADEHNYQPGWTLVGAGVFTSSKTRRPMGSVMPGGVRWIKDAVKTFDADNNSVVLESGKRLGYDYLVASPGIQLNWGDIPGLEETLGKNGVTSNYKLTTAPYTWELVQSLKPDARVIFTQSPMPIKCAGAPQKALYLSCSHWERAGLIKNLNVSFRLEGGVLFGVPDYVPALEGYMQRYGADVRFNERLVSIDGPAGLAVFEKDGAQEEVGFDMIHVCPPQSAPDFIRSSALANEAGWIDVDQATLQHARFPNIFALGDACSTPNAKTAAAVRKQAPVVAVNLLSAMSGEPLTAIYDGYGSCPLTVERGKVVLAEFGYGGKLLPTVPSWVNEGTRPTRLGWLLKAGLLPPIYFHLMLKGREWLAKPMSSSGQ